MSVGELQTTLDVTKQALNAPLRQLQEQGLIELTKADHDARVRQIRLTADGAALEAKLTENFGALDRTLTSTFQFGNRGPTPATSPATSDSQSPGPSLSAPAIDSPTAAKGTDKATR
jgi:hypothetical protein